MIVQLFSMLVNIRQNYFVDNFYRFFRITEVLWITLRGLNFADHSIREILTLSRGFNFADGPFRNILRISRMLTCPNFSQISRSDKAVLETGG